jgi:hypothetical protein
MFGYGERIWGMSKYRPDGFLRRNDITLCTPAENAIRAAVDAVEEAGAHPLLTDAVNLLDEAREKVADFIDNVPRYDFDDRRPEDRAISLETSLGLIFTALGSKGTQYPPDWSITTKILQRITEVDEEMRQLRNERDGYKDLYEKTSIERNGLMVRLQLIKGEAEKGLKCD